MKNNVKLLSLFNFFFNFRLYSVLAIIYFSEITHSYALGLSIFSIAQIVQALCEIPTGILSDRLGRRICLIYGAFASVFSITCYAIGQFYFVLIIGAVFEGIYRAFFSGNNDALLYESLSETNQKNIYHRVLGTIRSNLELSGLLSTWLGGIIAFKAFNVLMWLSILPQLICLIISFRFIEPMIHKENNDSIFFHLKEAVQYYKKNIKLRNLSLAGIIGYGIGEASWSFQAVFYNTLLPIWAVSFVMSLNFLASVISFRLSGKIIDKIKALHFLIYQEIYSRVLYIFALVFPTIISPFLLAVASIFYGPGEVAKNILLQKEFTDKQRATMASINSLVGSCLFAVFAFFIGMIADKLGAAKALLFAQICLFSVLFLYIKIFFIDKQIEGRS